jgi:hypothetical protein
MTNIRDGLAHATRFSIDTAIVRFSNFLISFRFTGSLVVASLPKGGGLLYRRPRANLIERFPFRV